jgi:predicted nucleic acid-binding protein
VRALVDELLTGAVELYTSHAVVAETLNGITRPEVRVVQGRESPLVILANLFHSWQSDEALEFLLGDEEDMASALALFAEFSDHPLSYVDCLTISPCRRHRNEEIVSGDDDFDKVNSGLRRLP